MPPSCDCAAPVDGSLEYSAEVIDHVERIAGTVPTVVDVFADRPAILEPIVECAVAVTLNWGASAAALLDVLTGAAEPQGRLPFDLPRSMAAVAASRPDVPFDTASTRCSGSVTGVSAVAADHAFRRDRGSARRERPHALHPQHVRQRRRVAAAVGPRELVDVEHELHRVVDRLAPRSSPSARR